jgi:hypothetical protein
MLPKGETASASEITNLAPVENSSSISSKSVHARHKLEKYAKLKNHCGSEPECITSFGERLSFMKIKFAILFIALFLNVQNTLAQIEKEITAIRADVATIDQGAARFRKTTKNVAGLSLEGTEATYYTSDRGLEKVAAKIYGETFNATAEFYFRNERLIFAFYRFNRYDAPISARRSPKVVNSEERRFYFSEGNLIRLLNGKTEVKPDNEKYSDMKDEVESVIEKLKEAYKGK